MPNDTRAELVRQARAWAEAFAQQVRNRDTKSALPLFLSDVRSYGTRAVEVHNLDELQRQQWTPTRNRTRGFDHVPDSMHVQMSQDGSIWPAHARMQIIEPTIALLNAALHMKRFPQGSAGQPAARGTV